MWKSGLIRPPRKWWGKSLPRERHLEIISGHRGGRSVVFWSRGICTCVAHNVFGCFSPYVRAGGSSVWTLHQAFNHYSHTSVSSLQTQWWRLYRWDGVRETERPRDDDVVGVSGTGAEERWGGAKVVVSKTGKVLKAVWAFPWGLQGSPRKTVSRDPIHL